MSDPEGPRRLDPLARIALVPGRSIPPRAAHTRPECTGPDRTGRDDAGTPLRERGVATRSRPKTARPPRFKVILYNDDYTPMEFVVALLERVFSKSPAAATELMLQIHRKGMGVAGVYVLEVAETKASTVHRLAEERGYPLRTGVEKE